MSRLQNIRTNQLVGFNIGDMVDESLDEARFNLATHVMSNGVELIIASDKVKYNDAGFSIPFSRKDPQQKPVTLAPSTLKNQMILALPTHRQENFTIPIDENQFITKTCLTTYTYHTTYLNKGSTIVEKREKVVSNRQTEERKFLRASSQSPHGVTLSSTLDLVVGVFPTTYYYYNLIKNNDLGFTSSYTVVNTITGPEDYISFLQPSEAATPLVDTNTYYSSLPITRTVQDGLGSIRIVTDENFLTQVIITESIPARDATRSPATTSANQIDLDVQIYATKTYSTTVTYRKTFSDLPSETNEKNEALFSSSNLQTKVIVNILTDIVPSSLLQPELVSIFRTELMQKKGKYDRKILVTLATLVSGETLQVTAVNIPITPPSATSFIGLNGQGSTSDVNSIKPSIVRNIIGVESTQGQSKLVLEENLDQNLSESENNNVYVKPLKEIPTQSPTSASSPTFEELIGSLNLQRFRPVFDVMADLIQKKIVNRKTQNKLEVWKNQANNISSQGVLDEKPLYIPLQIDGIHTAIQKDNLNPLSNLISESSNSNKHNINLSRLTAHSLHINPPETEAELDFPDATIDNSWQNSNNTAEYSESTIPAFDYRNSLLNNGIAIRPGEIINANADVIIGRPNGIRAQFVRPSSVFNKYMNQTSANYNGPPFRKKISPHPQITHDLTPPRVIPVRSVYNHDRLKANRNHNRLLADDYSKILRPPLQNPQIYVDFSASSIYQPSSIAPYKQPALSNNNPNYISNDNIYGSQQLIINLNSELHNNEILEIKQIPQIFSTQLPPITTYPLSESSYPPRVSQLPLKLSVPPTYSVHHHINLKTDVLSHNVNMNVPPLTFKKESDNFPHATAVQGHIATPHMPLVKIPLDKKHIEVRLTPHNTRLAVDLSDSLLIPQFSRPIFKLADPNTKQTSSTFKQRNQNFLKNTISSKNMEPNASFSSKIISSNVYPSKKLYASNLKIENQTDKWNIMETQTKWNEQSNTSPLAINLITLASKNEQNMDSLKPTYDRGSIQELENDTEDTLSQDQNADYTTHNSNYNYSPGNISLISRTATPDKESYFKVTNPTTSTVNSWLSLSPFTHTNQTLAMGQPFVKHNQSQTYKIKNVIPKKVFVASGERFNLRPNLEISPPTVTSQNLVEKTKEYLIPIIHHSQMEKVKQKYSQPNITSHEKAKLDYQLPFEKPQPYMEKAKQDYSPATITSQEKAKQEYRLSITNSPSLEEKSKQYTQPIQTSQEKTKQEYSLPIVTFQTDIEITTQSSSEKAKQDYSLSITASQSAVLNVQQELQLPVIDRNKTEKAKLEYHLNTKSTQTQMENAEHKYTVPIKTSQNLIEKTKHEYSQYTTSSQETANLHYRLPMTTSQSPLQNAKHEYGPPTITSLHVINPKLEYNLNIKDLNYKETQKQDYSVPTITSQIREKTNQVYSLPSITSQSSIRTTKILSSKLPPPSVSTLIYGNENFIKLETSSVSSTSTRMFITQTSAKGVLKSSATSTVAVYSQTKYIPNPKGIEEPSTFKQSPKPFASVKLDVLSILNSSPINLLNNPDSSVISNLLGSESSSSKIFGTTDKKPFTETKLKKLPVSISRMYTPLKPTNTYYNYAKNESHYWSYNNSKTSFPFLESSEAETKLAISYVNINGLPNKKTDFLDDTILTKSKSSTINALSQLRSSKKATAIVTSVKSQITHNTHPNLKMYSTLMPTTAAKNVRPDISSILIVMSKATGNENSNIIDTDVPVEYDSNISFELPIRDEENLPPINSNSVLLGGILIATPSKRQQSNSSNTCNPECKSNKNEICASVSEYVNRCECRLGFARMFPDRPCKPTYTFEMCIPIARVGNYLLKYKNEFINNLSSQYRHLSSITLDAIDRMVMQSDFRDVYYGVQSKEFLAYKDDAVLGNFLIQLSENSEEKRLETVFKKYLRQSNYSVGGTELYTSKENIHLLTVKDFDECAQSDFNDCSTHAQCFNLVGSYTCSCPSGYVDLSSNPIYPGRHCSDNIIGCDKCNYHGNCITPILNGSSVCECFTWHAGSMCQLNLKILLISLIAIGTVFIMLLVCMLLIYTRRKVPKSSTTRPIFVTASSYHPSILTAFSSKSGICSTTLIRKSSLDKRVILNDSNSESSNNSELYSFKDYNKIDPEQSDRSLTVMIPRAKYYHPTVLPHTQLKQKELTLEKVKGTQNGNNKVSGLILDSSKTSETERGALISAGFEVSAIVSDQAIQTIDWKENGTDRESSKGQEISRANLETILDSGKDIHRMSSWMSQIPSNAISSDVRSFDETTVRAVTKSLHLCFEKQTPSNTNEAGHTMAERDIGSTFLLPHTHLYKPEKIESDLSGFDSN